MCQLLRIEDGGEVRELGLVAELAQLVAPDRLVWGPGARPDPSPRCCLCSIDLVATGRALGYEVDTESWPWGVIWRRAA